MCSATSLLALEAGIEMRIEFMETKGLRHFPLYCPLGALKGAWRADWAQSRLEMLCKVNI